MRRVYCQSLIDPLERSAQTQHDQIITRQAWLQKLTVFVAYNGTSSIIPTAPSLPTVIITSPNVFVVKPASQYEK